MAQLKKLTFEELKDEFENLMKSIESFVPMGTEERVKRPEPVFVKEEEIENPMKKRGKIKKQMARKGTDILVSAVPIAIKPPSIVNCISRDDLTELYRIVIQRYGTNGPEDEYERVLWGDLKTMFDPPLKSADINMLTERRYHIPADVCHAMLDKKLQGNKKDEACYQLLKLIKKQTKNNLP
ncbi:hypothetical protein Tco_1225851 [Tanacetum coccineum]